MKMSSNIAMFKGRVNFVFPRDRKILCTLDNGIPFTASYSGITSIEIGSIQTFIKDDHNHILLEELPEVMVSWRPVENIPSTSLQVIDFRKERERRPVKSVFDYLLTNPGKR